MGLRGGACGAALAGPSRDRYVMAARRGGAAGRAHRAITIRWTSDVPSPISKYLGVTVETADREVVHEPISAKELGRVAGVIHRRI